MKAELVKSSISGVTQSVVGLILVLITIPVFVRTLGTEAYGLFSLIALVGSFNTFVNLGLNAALVRFLAEQGKSAESDMDIVVTLLILFSVILPLTFCAILYRNLILIDLFNVPSPMLIDGQWLFFSMLIGNVFVLVGQTFTAILDSQQKVYLTNLFQMFYSVTYWGSILVVVMLGFTLKAVAVASLAATSIWFFGVSFIGLRSWGKLSLRSLRSSARRIVRKQLSYGLQIYMGGLIYVLYEPLTKILLSHLIGVADVGIYDIGLRVKNQIYGFASKILYPLFPLISRISNPEKVRNIVHDVEQKTLYLVLPLVGIILLSVRPLVSVFFHSNVDAIAITIAFIVPGYLIGSSTVTPMYQYLLVKGHAGKTVLIQSTNAFVNALTILLLFSKLGYYSVVAGNTLAIVASCGFLIYFQHKYLGSVVFDTAKQAAGVIMTFFIAVGLGFSGGKVIGLETWRILVGPIIVLLVTTLGYRLLGLVKTRDVVRYLGENNIVSRLFVRVLCNTQSHPVTLA